jgi:hypothetical protein
LKYSINGFESVTAFDTVTAAQVVPSFEVATHVAVVPSEAVAMNLLFTNLTFHQESAEGIEATVQVIPSADVIHLFVPPSETATYLPAP